MQASRRMESYRLLADCYYPPEEELLMKLQASEGVFNGSLSSLVEKLERKESIKDIAVDAARLFIGPFKLLAPPYGSVYLEESGTILGDSTINAEKTYIGEGLKLELKEPPDHIAVELEFISYLVFLQIQALQDNDTKLADTYLGKQLSFLNRHLSHWVFDFAEKIVSNAQTEFYKNIGRQTRLFIRGELDYLNDGR